jgi:hypothetical protein
VGTVIPTAYQVVLGKARSPSERRFLKRQIPCFRTPLAGHAGLWQDEGINHKTDSIYGY